MSLLVWWWVSGRAGRALVAADSPSRALELLDGDGWSVVEAVEFDPPAAEGVRCVLGGFPPCG